jgi:hypothetical protein
MQDSNTLLRLLSVGAVISILTYMSCSSGDEPEPIDCSTTTLAITVGAQVNPASCLTNSGSITVTATGGAAPYQFKLDNGSYGSSTTFSNLGGGSYTVTVKDKNGCEKQSLAIVLVAPSGPVAEASTISSQTNCLEPDGSITANVTGGAEPYMYKIGTGSFDPSPTFTGLKAGNYTITVQDDADCTITINATVASNTGVSYETQIKPILQVNCIKSTCHDGSSALPNWSNLSTVQANAQNIKLRTGNGTMPADQPGGLPQSERDLIACWVDEGAQDN